MVKAYKRKEMLDIYGGNKLYDVSFFDKFTHIVIW